MYQTLKFKKLAKYAHIGTIIKINGKVNCTNYLSVVQYPICFYLFVSLDVLVNEATRQQVEHGEETFPEKRRNGQVRN